MLLIFAAPLISLLLYSSATSAHSLQGSDPSQEHHYLETKSYLQKNIAIEALHPPISHHALMKHSSMLMDVCDYCQLFHHTPYAPIVSADMNKLADVQRQQQPPAPTIIADIRSDVSIRPPVRAPPVFSVI